MFVRVWRDSNWEVDPAPTGVRQSDTDGELRMSTLLFITRHLTTVDVILTPFRNLARLVLQNAHLYPDDLWHLAKMVRLEELDFGRCFYVNEAKGTNEVPAFVISEILGQRLPRLQTLVLGRKMAITEASVPNISHFSKAGGLLDDDMLEAAMVDTRLEGEDVFVHLLFPALRAITFVGTGAGCRAFCTWLKSPLAARRLQVRFGPCGQWRGPDDLVRDDPQEWANGVKKIWRFAREKAKMELDLR